MKNRMIRKRNLPRFGRELFFFLVLITFLGCSDDENNGQPGPQWKKLGLDGKTVNEMQIANNQLYVATTTGLFKRVMDDEDADFIALGFEGKNVEAIEVMTGESLIVSVYNKSGSESPGLYKSTDDGETWLPLESNFGGNAAEPVFDLERHPDNENVLYATGFSVVAKSSDGGENWTPVYGDWGGFATGISVVEINPNDVNEVWAGGQGAIENGFLLRSINDADWDSWANLVENPTVVKEITFKTGNKEQILVGFEGALLKTTDGGEHWQTLIESDENRFYFGIGMGAGNDGRVYAGGWLKTPSPQPLVLYVSDNGGEAWKEFQFPNESYGGILELQMNAKAGQDIVYIGLDKGGVYQVTFSR
jgi:photosystem II stability/assembly factor-like uncharacterized protein